VVQVPDLVELFVRPLERFGLPYMVTGGVATVLYGEALMSRISPDLSDPLTRVDRSDPLS
jgi:hypothetical protein